MKGAAVLLLIIQLDMIAQGVYICIFSSKIIKIFIPFEFQNWAKFQNILTHPIYCIFNSRNRETWQRCLETVQHWFTSWEKLH